MKLFHLNQLIHNKKMRIMITTMMRMMIMKVLTTSLSLNQVIDDQENKKKMVPKRTRYRKTKMIATQKPMKIAMWKRK